MDSNLKCLFGFLQFLLQIYNVTFQKIHVVDTLTLHARVLMRGSLFARNKVTEAKESIYKKKKKM